MYARKPTRQGRRLHSDYRLLTQVQRGYALRFGLESHPADKAETEHHLAAPPSLTPTLTPVTRPPAPSVQHLPAPACRGRISTPLQATSPLPIPCQLYPHVHTLALSGIPIPLHSPHNLPHWPLPTSFYTTPFKSSPALLGCSDSSRPYPKLIQPTDATRMNCFQVFTQMPPSHHSGLF